MVGDYYVMDACVTELTEYPADWASLTAFGSDSCDVASVGLSFGGKIIKSVFFLPVAYTSRSVAPAVVGTCLPYGQGQFFKLNDCAEGKVVLATGAVCDGTMELTAPAGDMCTADGDAFTLGRCAVGAPTAPVAGPSTAPVAAPASAPATGPVKASSASSLVACSLAFAGLLLA
jgi:hypothetical protein